MVALPNDVELTRSPGGELCTFMTNYLKLKSSAHQHKNNESQLYNVV